MCMYVRLCVYVYMECIYVCMHVRMFVCMQACKYVCMFVCMRMPSYTHTHTHTHMLVCVLVHTYIHTCVCVCVGAHTHAFSRCTTLTCVRCVHTNVLQTLLEWGPEHCTTPHGGGYLLDWVCEKGLLDHGVLLVIFMLFSYFKLCKSRGAGDDFFFSTENEIPAII